MPTLNLGRVRFNMRGPYDPNSDYLTHDVVTDDGQSYVCIADVTGTGPNDAGGVTYWEGMLLRGADYDAARDQAIQAANDAGSSATAASQSANAAASDRGEAQVARDKSQAWAESETAPEPGSKSAKTWAEEAASYGDPNQHNVTANGTADTRTAAEWAGQTLSNQQAINGLGTASAANVGTGANDVPKTSQADARYARLSGANNFDTMPAVAGSPLIESDSNSNGKWVRFADGTQFCSQIATGRDINISNPAGALYRTPSQGTWNFPASFLEEPVGDVTATGTGSLFWSSVTTSNASGSGMDFYYVGYSSGVRESCVERFFAKGRWKA